MWSQALSMYFFSGEFAVHDFIFGYMTLADYFLT